MGKSEWGVGRHRRGGGEEEEGEHGKKNRRKEGRSKRRRGEERSASESPLVAVDTCPLGEEKRGGHLSSSQRGTIPVRHFSSEEGERKRKTERESEGGRRAQKLDGLHRKLENWA